MPAGWTASRVGGGCRLTRTRTHQYASAFSITITPRGLLVADGGFAAHWGGLLFDTKAAGRFFVPDRGFASIGYGLPGAMGAAPDAA